MGRFLLPLLAHHDHEAFEIVAYSSVRRGDAITDRLRSHVDDWQNIAGLSDAQAADKIRADGIDILVDLSLHTAQNRMLLFCPQAGPGAGDVAGLRRHHRLVGDGLPHSAIRIWIRRGRGMNFTWKRRCACRTVFGVTRRPTSRRRSTIFRPSKTGTSPSAASTISAK